MKVTCDPVHPNTGHIVMKVRPEAYVTLQFPRGAVYLCTMSIFFLAR